MPELPEVETVRRALQNKIMGQKITEVEVFYPKMISPDVRTFVKDITGAVFLAPERIGKYLFLHLDNGKTIVSHLRMEGKYQFGAAVESKHCHVQFKTQTGILSYLDTRKFGTMELVETSNLLKTKAISKLGPEPFFETCTPTYVHQTFKKRKSAIKTVLLDQTVMCGIGNIYADEILFAAKIHPLTHANLLTQKKCATIIDEARRILANGIKAGGASIRTYQSVDSIDGMFQLELKVHMQKDQPCGECQTKIEKIQVGGRGTYFCPRCQKLKKERAK